MEAGTSRSPAKTWKRGGGSSSSSTGGGRGRGDGSGSRGASRGRGVGRGGSANASWRRKPTTTIEATGQPLFIDLEDSVSSSEDEVQVVAAPKPKRPAAVRAVDGSAFEKRRPTTNLYDPEAEAARKSRFETATTENRYLQLKPSREKERRDAIASGLIPDPLKPRRLDEAISFQGTCMDMCPEFEREEREYQKNVDKWEMTPGTSRIDRYRAVKAFHRPAAGNEQPMPSDVRPPEILSKTLDYLFHDVLAQDPKLADSHPFLRDRTRAVRQDFTMQNERGPLAIECHERIARYHILCLHVLRESETFSESQELEQLRKVLQSLNEFYDDARHEGLDCPQEAEFRAYYLITHLRDADTIRQTELLPHHIFSSEHVQAALRLQSLAQRNNESKGERGRRPANSEASLNAFSRFFKTVASDQTSYLLACLVESHFTDVRRGALVSLRKAYIPQHREYPIAKLARMLGCDDAEHCAEVAHTFSLEVMRDLVSGIPKAVELHKNVLINEYPPTIPRHASRTIVGAKQGRATFQSIIDGNFYSAHIDVARSLIPAPAPTPYKPSIKNQVGRTPSMSIAKVQSVPPSPPTTRPASPAPISVFGSSASKPAFSGFNTGLNTGLNAKASVFTPSAPSAFSSTNAKPMKASTPPSALSIKPAPADLNIKQASQSPAPPAVSTDFASLAAPRSPLQPRHTSPKINVPAATSQPQRKAPARTPSVSSAKGKPVGSSTALSVTSRDKVNLIVPELLDMVLADFLQTASRQAAVNGIRAIRVEREAAQAAVTQEAVQQCSGELLGRLIHQMCSESSAEALASVQHRRTVTRKRLLQWRRRLHSARAARRAREERQRRFDGLAKAIGGKLHGRKDNAISGVNDLPDLSQLEIQNIDEDTEVTTAEAIQHNFWTPKTISSLVCRHVDKAFSAFRHQDVKPDWRMLVVIDDLNSSIATWWRCKLGIERGEDGRIVMLSNVRIEFSLVSPEDVADGELEHIGLVIINEDLTEKSRELLSSLTSNLSNESKYQSALIHVGWSGKRQEDNIFEKSILVDTESVDGGVAQALSGCLASITFNDTSAHRVPARDAVWPFLEAYRSGLQRAFAKSAKSEDMKTHLQVANAAIGLLVDIGARLRPFVDVEDDLLYLSKVESADTHSLQDLLVNYLSSDSLRNNVSLSYLKLQILQSGPNISMILPSFASALVEAFLQSCDGLCVEAEAAKTELPEELADYTAFAEDSIDDLLASLPREVSPAKKRRRVSSSNEIKTPDATPKRQREDIRPVVQLPKPSAWMPDKVSSLASLISETKALLGK